VRTFHSEDDLGGNRRALSSDSERAAHNLRPIYNICPADPVDIVVADDEKRDLCRCDGHWCPLVVKATRGATRTFDARAETVETKPFFRDAFNRTRCLIPLSGYYEWQDTPTGK
jgi:putative SOS response-associated peptidase YedK